MDNEITAYLYGEMPETQVHAFEKRMQEDPDLLAEVEGLRATQEFLDADLKSGIENGADLPPPHLLNAIMRAEIIERPASIREAIIARSKKDEPWHKRFFLSLLGGGALATTAVVVIFISVNSNLDKAEAPASVTLQRPGTAEPAAEAAADAPGADTGMLDALKDSKQDLAKLGGKGMKTEQKAAADPALSEGRGAAGSAASGNIGDGSSVAKKTASKMAPKASKRARTESGKSADSEASPLADARPADEAERDDDGAFKEEAQAEAPAKKPAAAPKRRKAKAKTRATAPAPPPNAPASAGASQGSAESTESAREAMSRGNQALNARKYNDALNHFRQAVKLDTTGKQGVKPYVGMMKAYDRSGRTQSALKQQSRMEKASIKTPGAAEGLWLSAQIRERLNQKTQAVRLYKKLLKSNTYRARAQARLDAISEP
jgi:hypothetical protein